jgi:protein translocase SecG subunit
MQKIINIAEIAIALLLIVSILLQNRGAGLSSTFGGDFGGYYTRRGFEKFLVIASIVLASLFIVFAVLNLILAK